jgi:hypothetical protein
VNRDEFVRRFDFALRSASYDTLPVRFSFLWRTVTTQIPLDEPLGINFPKRCHA